MLAIALAVVAVLVSHSDRSLPYIGLSLAGTFCVYGLVRKTISPADRRLCGGSHSTSVPLALSNGNRQSWAGSFRNQHLQHIDADGLWALHRGRIAVLFLVAETDPLFNRRNLAISLALLVFLTAVFVFGEHVGPWKLTRLLHHWTAARNLFCLIHPG